MFAALLLTIALAGVPQNNVIETAVATGERLPAGDVYFTPPLVIRGGMNLQGSLAPGGTTLRPVMNAGGPLVVADNYGDFTPMSIRDVKIVGNGPDRAEYGLVINGARITVDNVVVSDAYGGLQVRFSVDNDITRSMFTRNRYGALLLEWNAITTTRFISTQFRESGVHGVLIRHGNDVVFDHCIIESNGAYGLVIEGTGVERVLIDNFWFENNLVDIHDPYGVVKLGTGRFVARGTNKMRWFERGKLTLSQ